MPQWGKIVRAMYHTYQKDSHKAVLLYLTQEVHDTGSLVLIQVKGCQLSICDPHRVRISIVILLTDIYIIPSPCKLVNGILIIYPTFYLCFCKIQYL